MGKSCTNCGRGVPFYTKVGSHCPHCSAYFKEEYGGGHDPEETLIGLVFIAGLLLIFGFIFAKIHLNPPKESTVSATSTPPPRNEANVAADSSENKDAANANSQSSPEPQSIVESPLDADYADVQKVPPKSLDRIQFLLPSEMAGTTKQSETSVGEPRPDLLVYRSREWTDASGKFRFNGRLVEYRRDERAVVLHGDNGKSVTVPLDRLSKVDQQLVRDGLHDPDGEESPTVD